MALFKNITIGQYIPKLRHPSLIHTKIIGTVLLIVLLFMVDSFLGYIAAVAIFGIVQLSEFPGGSS